MPNLSTSVYLYHLINKLSYLKLDVKTLKDHGTRPSEIRQLTAMKDASSTAKKIEMVLVKIVIRQNIIITILS